MAERLRRIRAVLTMDASDAMERASLRYLALHRRHPHVVNYSLLGATFLILWWAAGLRVAVIVVGGLLAITLGVVALFTIVVLVRVAFRRQRDRSR